MTNLGRILTAAIAPALLLATPHRAWSEIKDVPKEFKAKQGTLATLVVKADTKVKYVNVHEPAISMFREATDDGSLVYKLLISGEAAPGSYRIGFYTASKDGVPSEPSYTTVIVEGKVVPPGPGPQPPNPPGPQPPGPSPDGAPIAVQGLSVLIVSDPNESLPPKQAAILTSQTLRKYLREKCAKDSDAQDDGRAYRIWLKSEDVSGAAKVWQDAMKREKKSLPWIVVSNGAKGTGYEGPLPATVEDTVALVKKYE